MNRSIYLIPHCRQYTYKVFMKTRHAAKSMEKSFIYIPAHHYIIRSFHSTRINFDNKQKSEEGGAGKEKEELNQKKDDNVQPLSERLKPYIDKYQSQYETTTAYLHRLQSSLMKQYSNVKQAIQSANVKLAQIEKEEMSKYNFNETSTGGIIPNLPSAKNRKRQLWTKRLELYLDSLQETLLTATRALNDVTGYSSIQQLRESIDSLEIQLDSAKEQLRNAKLSHQQAIKQRSQTQHEINELLQRKSQWTPEDLHHFTELYTKDHTNTTMENQTCQNLEFAEKTESELQDTLSRAILTRYHEEQIWSDKIRRMSTWGTFILMGVNILLFLIFQLFLEPWKRKRLVSGFEDKVRKALEVEQIQKQKQNIGLEEKLDLVMMELRELKDKKSVLDDNDPYFTGIKEESRDGCVEGEGEIIDDFKDIEELVKFPEILKLPIQPYNDDDSSITRYWCLFVHYSNYILTELTVKILAPYRLFSYPHYEQMIIKKQEIQLFGGTILTIGIGIGCCLMMIVRSMT